MLCQCRELSLHWQRSAVPSCSLHWPCTAMGRSPYLASPVAPAGGMAAGPAGAETATNLGEPRGGGRRPGGRGARAEGACSERREGRGHDVGPGGTAQRAQGPTLLSTQARTHAARARHRRTQGMCACCHVVSGPSHNLHAWPACRLPCRIEVGPQCTSAKLQDSAMKHAWHDAHGELEHAPTLGACHMTVHMTEWVEAHATQSDSRAHEMCVTVPQ